VIPAGFDYLRPATIAQALEMANRHQDAAFLAGGHALLPEWKLNRTGPSTLIDLGRIAELRGIELLSDGGAREAGGSGRPGRAVRIGAMTTSAEIEYSADIARAAPLLARAAAVISDPLIRNRATLGGSLAEASPSGDWPPVVLAADATIHLRSRDSERAVPASDFFTTAGAGFGQQFTTLRRGELLTAVTVPAANPLARSTYLKRMHPASGHAMIGVAVAATFDTSETCHQCRIAITGVSAIATRAVRAEECLVGSRLTADVIEGAANVAADGIAFAGDAFGSTAYLAELLPVYVRRALAQIAAPLTHESRPGSNRTLEGDENGHDHGA
jgi:aerobic carbon-monoxide dehydrogenase medium subunit